ncbi:hypothetical protein KC343_g147 [Hortaea werneckii]|nr:hypothetical protein KC343_g147 [Hortaea werneckii]
MAAHTATGSASLDLDDPAFQPQAGFDFEDMVHESLSDSSKRFGMTNHYSPTHDGSGIERFGTRDGRSPTEGDLNHQGAFVQPAPIDIRNQPDSNQSPYRFAFRTNAAYLSGSEQSGITQQRSNVAQHFGQITPPDDSTEFETPNSRPRLLMLDDVALKMNKSQRARNAANKRRAKSKKARENALRKDSGQDVAGDGEEDAEDKREKYRQKNRLAAAKCRAKQKQGNEGLSERFSRLKADNAFMKQENRALRNESKLRLEALSHNPNACYCHNVHCYNVYKAREVATGFGSRYPRRPIVFANAGLDTTVTSSTTVKGSSADDYYDYDDYVFQPRRMRSGKDKHADAQDEDEKNCASSSVTVLVQDLDLLSTVRTNLTSDTSAHARIDYIHWQLSEATKAAQMSELRRKALNAMLETSKDYSAAFGVSELTLTEFTGEYSFTTFAARTEIVVDTDSSTWTRTR